MKNEVSPAAIIGLVAVAVIMLVVFGYRMLQPAPYTPSPGAGTAPRNSANYSPGGPTGGGIPGKPVTGQQ